MGFPVCCSSPPPSFNSPDELRLAVTRNPDFLEGGTKVKVQGRVYRIDSAGHATEKSCFLVRLWRHCFGDRNVRRREEEITGVLQQVLAVGQAGGADDAQGHGGGDNGGQPSVSPPPTGLEGAMGGGSPPPSPPRVTLPSGTGPLIDTHSPATTAANQAQYDATLAAVAATTARAAAESAATCAESAPLDRREVAMDAAAAAARMANEAEAAAERANSAAGRASAAAVMADAPEASPETVQAATRLALLAADLAVNARDTAEDAADAALEFAAIAGGHLGDEFHDREMAELQEIMDSDSDNDSLGVPEGLGTSPNIDGGHDSDSSSTGSAPGPAPLVSTEF